MSPPKRAPKRRLVPRPLANFVKFLAGPGRTMALALVMVSLFGSAWYWGWQQVRGDVVASTAYTLSPEDIVVTDRPSWMSFDISERVFRGGDLQQTLSIMDPNLNERIATAFSLRPWVAKVNRVSKRYPASVMVDLDYRHPVCMVHTGDGVIPIDVEGNALPQWDIPLSEVDRYPRLDWDSSGLSTPRGPAGEQWGDPRIVGAAEIAAALGDRWKSYRLQRIEPVLPDTKRIGDTVYKLYTQSGSTVIWGRAPSMAVPGLPTTAEKLAYLDREIEEHGTLEGPNGHRQDISLPFLIL